SSVMAKSFEYFSNSASSRIKGSKLGMSDSTAFRISSIVMITLAGFKGVLSSSRHGSSYETMRITLPRKTSSDCEFRQGDFYAQGNLARFAQGLRAAGERAQAGCELLKVKQRSCVAHPSTFLFAPRRSFRADQLRDPPP